MQLPRNTATVTGCIDAGFSGNECAFYADEFPSDLAARHTWKKRV